MSRRISSIISIVILLCIPVSNTYSQLSQWNWARSISSDSNEQINAIAVDKSNNDVYVAGKWQDDISDVFPTGTNPSTDFANTYGEEDGFVVKYDSAGELIWAFKLGGESNDAANSIALDSDGNLYVTGFFGTGTSYFSGMSPHTGSSTLTNSSNIDFFIAKYNSDGEFVWVKRSDSDNGGVAGVNLTTTSSALYAVGHFTRNTAFGSLSTDQNPNQQDLFLIKYNLEGDELWLAEAGSNDDDNATSVIADESGVYCTGYYSGSTLDIFDGTGSYAGFIENTNSGSRDILLLSLDQNGTYSWSRKISSNDAERGRSITMDADSLYLTGAINDNATFPGYSGNPVSTSSNRDVFISSHAKSNGNTGWVVIPPCLDPGDQRGRNIDTDGNGNLYITGEFKQDLIFSTDVSLSAAGEDDVFLASYSSNGLFRWARSAGSTGTEDANALAAGKSGTVFIGGGYTELFSAGTLTLPSDPGNNGYLVKVSEYPPGENGDPCSAFLLPVGDTCNSVTYDNNGASDSGLPDPGCGTYVGGDVWFKAVIPESGNLFIGTNASEDDTYPPANGWMYQVEMALYTGSCGALSLEGCYSQTSGYNYRTSSAFLFDKNPGDTIWIRIWDAIANNFGNFSICIYDPGHYPGWNIPMALCEDGGIIDLDTCLAKTRLGYADEVEGSSGVQDIGNIIGDPDGETAKLYDTGDWTKLDLTDTIPPGEALLLYFHSNIIVSGPTQMKLLVSEDDITYFPLSFNPETEMDVVTPHYLITEHPTRYLYLENDNAGGGGFAVDAVMYFYRGTKGGTWSGPGVSASLFDPSGLSGPISITYSAGGSSNRTDSTIITLISNTEAGALSGDTLICSGSNEVRLRLQGAQGDLFTWESSEDGFISISSSGIAAPSFSISDLSNTTEVWVIAQGTGCEPDTSNLVTITVIEDPVSDPGPGGETCGNTFGLQANPSSGLGQWSKSSGPGNASFMPSTDDPNVVVEVDEFGDYEFTWTETNGICLDDSSLMVTFFESPLINPGVGGDTCGLSFGLNALASVGDGLWKKESGPGSATFLPSDTVSNPLVTVSDYGLYSFTWTEVNGSCTKDETITVNFIEIPIANPGPGGSTCGNSFGLQAIPSSGLGQWSKTRGPGDATFLPSAEDQKVSVEVDEFGDYEFTWTETNGICLDDSSLMVTFFEPPLINPGVGGDTCGLSFGLNALASVGNGLWKKESGPGSATFLPSDTVSNPLVTVSHYGSYRFTWSEVNGFCSADGNIEVTFSEPPAVNPGEGGEVCGLEFGLDAIPSFGEGTWSLVSGPGSISFTPSGNAPDAIATADEYGSYDIMWTETNTVCSNDSLVRLTFTPPPESYAGPDVEICSDETSFTITGASSSNGTIEWTSRGNGSFDSSGSDNPGYTVEPGTESIVLYKKVLGEGSCSDAVDSMILDVIPTPAANAGKGGEICGLEFQLSAEPGMYTGTWARVSGPGSVTFQPGPSHTDAIAFVTQPGLYEFSWTEVNGLCSDMDIVKVNFAELITVDAGVGGAVCGQEISLLASPGEGSGHWTLVSGPGNPSYYPSDTINKPEVSVDEFGEYVFQWQVNLGECQGRDTVWVSFIPQAVADAGPDQVLEFVFTSQLNAHAPESGQGSWRIVEGEGQIEDPLDPLSLLSDLGLGANIFRWSVLSDVCEDVYDDVRITVNDLDTPTVITPNGDGQNDFLIIPGVDQLTGCELLIFNRWGSEVYHNKDYQNDWDGKDHKGRDLIPDTYFYILKIPSERTFQSFIEIRR